MAYLVDLLILAVVGWSIAHGARRGLVRSTLDLAVVLLAVSAALAWYGWAAAWATRQLGLRYAVAQPIAFALIALAALLLLGLAARLLAGPFQPLLAGTAVDLLLSAGPAAARGLAIAGLGLALVLAPPPLLDDLAPGALADLQEAVQRSQLAPPIAGGIAAYERWVERLIPLPQELAGGLGADQPAGGTAAVKRLLPNAPLAGRPLAPGGAPAPQPPTTGQAYPREVQLALGLLDQAGDPWVRETLDRWVSAIRFAPGAGPAGHLPGSVSFGQTSLSPRPDGGHGAEIALAQGQSRRGRFLAGWLAHEATHVLQANTGQTTSADCAARESLAYLIQGYVLLDLFGQDLEAVRRAAGVQPHEVRYAAAAVNDDLEAMARYVRETGECR